MHDLKSRAWLRGHTLAAEQGLDPKPCSAQEGPTFGDMHPSLIPHNDNFKCPLIPRTVIAWNALPPVVVDCTSLNSFRVALSDVSTT